MANKELCSNCYQGITNPICEKCKTKELAVWMNDYPINQKIIRYVIGKIRNSYATPHENNEAFCILCCSELLTICTYCYFLKVEKILTELALPEETVEKFLETFNYKLYHN